LLLNAPDPTVHQVMSEYALYTLAVFGDASDASNFASALHPLKARRVRHAAAWSIPDVFARLEEDQVVPFSRRIQPGLLAMLDDDDVDMRASAVSALGDVGDESAERVLRALAKQTTVDWFRDRALEAASSIRNRNEGATEPKSESTEEDEATLQERIDDLQERLERLEDWR
jgi:HEAT repeat protein